MRLLYLVLAALLLAPPSHSRTLSLEQCRSLALERNKKLRIMDERVKAAGYQKRQALSAYLPAIDFAGGYLYNQKEISIFDSDQLLPTKSFNPATGQYDFNLVTNPATGAPVLTPDGHPIPSTVALIPKEAMTYNIHHVMFGAVTLTQPIYMGGKIVAMNKIAGFADKLAAQLRDSEAENVVYAVDGAYWQVVSLCAKQRLALSYVALLDTLNRNVRAMVEQGVATQSDLLSVEVKLNQAQVDMVKVDNGLSLSRMALAQLCGLQLDTPFTLADEQLDTPVSLPDIGDIDMADVYRRRHDVQALELGSEIFSGKVRVARAGMLPTVALLGTYSLSNPNMFDGFKRRFGGAFSVGAMVQIPLWHWGGDYNKYRQARTDAAISRLELEEAKEKIELQVSQARFKAQEAVKTYHLTESNLRRADQNLAHADIGFREGVLAVNNVMEAQTAWLKAYSEKIDAEIEMYLCHTYLTKVIGRMPYQSNR